MRLGIHASVRRGFVNACAQAAELSAQSLQIFPRPPGRPFIFPEDSEVRAMDAQRADNGLNPLAVHSVYQPNIASSQTKIRQRSFDSLVEELRFANHVHAEFLVIHSGNFSPGSDFSGGLSKSAQAIRNALDQTGSKTIVLIENVAGGDRRMGSTFQELRALLDSVDRTDQTGVCFDTAHAFAAGYPVNHISGMADTLSDFDNVIGLRRLKLFHLNDSGAARGSRRDIHQHIGKGEIGAEPIRWLVRRPEFDSVAGIIETPAHPPGSNQTNLRILREP